jgi:hypothetical protein
MREAYAITGYVQNEIAEKLKSHTAGAIQVKPERGAQQVVMHVDGSDVVEIRKGSSSGGETLVQLILRDKAVVRTVVETAVKHQGVELFHDPAIMRMTAAATAKQIVV